MQAGRMHKSGLQVVRRATCGRPRAASPGGFKCFAPFGFVRYADEHRRPWGAPGAPIRAPTLSECIAQKAWLCGSPIQVIDTIREFEVC
jgi:hypothetical protein